MPEPRPEYPNMYTNTGGRPGITRPVTPNKIARNAYYPEGDQAMYEKGRFRK